jgi:hypothetical protein
VQFADELAKVRRRDKAREIANKTRPPFWSLFPGYVKPVADWRREMLRLTEFSEQRVAVTGFTCDCCKSTYEEDDWVEMQEYLHFENTGGFGSVFGDGVYFEITLCQMCVKMLLGPHIQYPVRTEQ